MERVVEGRLSTRFLKKRLDRLKSERGTLDTHVQDVTDYVLPRKNTIITQRTPGEKRALHLLDSTGVYANELLAGFLHGTVTNPDLQWFDFTTGNDALDRDQEVAKYLSLAARTVNRVLNGTNFQTELHEVYIDLPAIGTACMLIEEDKESVVRFSTMFFADYWLEEDRHGMVNEIHREWKSNAASLVEQFGVENLPKKVTEAFTKGDECKFCVVHSVYPKYLVDEKFSKDAGWLSTYYLADVDCHEISHGKFRSFPYVVPRWSKASGEKYGRGPGMTALPDLKVLNKMTETQLIGSQKVVDPPVQIPDDGFTAPLQLGPGGITYYRSGTQDYIRPVFNDTRIDFGYQAIEDRRKRVRDAFYVDQLRLQQGGPMMTATEVMQRTEESARLLGPLMGRMLNELAAPIVDRTLPFVFERGMLPEPPPVLQGRNIQVRFSSLIAKSQRVQDANALMRFIQASAAFIQLDQASAQWIDSDTAVRHLADVYGVTADVIRSQSDVEGMREQQAAAAQAQQAAAQETLQAQGTLDMVRAMNEAQGG